MSYDEENRRREEQRRDEQRREDQRREQHRQDDQRRQDEQRREELRREQQRKGDIHRQEEQRRRDDERAQEQRRQDDARAQAKRQETSKHYDEVDDRRRELHRALDTRDVKVQRDNKERIDNKEAEDREDRRAAADREEVNAQSAACVDRIRAISKRGQKDSYGTGALATATRSVLGATMHAAGDVAAERAAHRRTTAQQVPGSGSHPDVSAGARTQFSRKGGFRTAFGMIAVVLAAALGLTAYLGGLTSTPLLSARTPLKTVPDKVMTQQEVRAILLGTDRTARSQYRLASSLAMGKNGLQLDNCLAAYFADKAFKNPTASAEFEPEMLAAVKSLHDMWQPSLVQCKVTIRTGSPKAPLYQLVNVKTKLWHNPNVFSALKG